MVTIRYIPACKWLIPLHLRNRLEIAKYLRRDSMARSRPCFRSFPYVAYDFAIVREILKSRTKHKMLETYVTYCPSAMYEDIRSANVDYVVVATLQTIDLARLNAYRT